MSLQQSLCVWQQSLKPGAKLVLLALADYANDQGQCYPSLKHLQRKTGFARSTLLSHLSWLRQQGFITVKHQHDKKGYRRNNLYQLHLRPAIELNKVQHSDGNKINGHINSHKLSRGLNSGRRRVNTFYAKQTSALKGAI